MSSVSRMILVSGFWIFCWFSTELVVSLDIESFGKNLKEIAIPASSEKVVQKETNKTNYTFVQNALDKNHSEISMTVTSEYNYTPPPRPFSEETISDSYLADTNLHGNVTKKHTNTSSGGTRHSRPFGFEYRSPRPAPFQNGSGMFSRVNKQMKYDESNIQQFIKFVSEKMYEGGNIVNPQRRVKFSGVYKNPKSVETPQQEDDDVRERGKASKFRDSSLNGHAYNTDPLFQYKPSQPGDINMLAEKMFRFSPTSVQTIKRPRGCQGYSCYNAGGYQQVATLHNLNHGVSYTAQTEDDYREIEGFSTSTKTNKKINKRPFSVMLDVYPVNQQDEEVMAFPEHLKEPVETITAVQPNLRPIFYPPYAPNDIYANPNYLNTYNNVIPEYYRSSTHYNADTSKANRPRLAIYRNPQKNLHNMQYERHPKVNKNTPVQMLIYLNVYPKIKLNKYQIYEDKPERMDINQNDLDIPDSESLNTYRQIKSFETSADNIDKQDLKKMLGESFDSKVNLNYSKNITIDEIRQGHGFMIPGPQLI